MSKEKLTEAQYEEFDYITDFYMPIKEVEDKYNSPHLKRLRDAKIDSYEYLGLEKVEGVGEIKKIEDKTELAEAKKTVGQHLIDFAKDLPEGTVTELGEAGANVLNNVVQLFGFGSNMMFKGTKFDEVSQTTTEFAQGVNKGTEEFIAKLNKYKEENDINGASELVNEIGIDIAAFVPINKMLKKAGVPDKVSTPLAFGLAWGFTGGDDELEKSNMFIDSEVIHGVNELLGILPDTPESEVAELVGNTFEGTIWGGIGDQLVRVFKIIKNNVPAFINQQTATAVGGSAIAGSAAMELQEQTPDLNVENEEIPPLEIIDESLTDEQSAIPGTVNEYGFPLQAGLNVGAVSKMLSTKGGEAISSLQKLGAKNFIKKTRANFNKLAEEGKLGKDWYKKSGQNILNYVGGDKKAADQFAQLLAIYSPQKPVATNTQFAIKAWNKFQSGDKIWNGEILERATIPQDLNITQKAKFKKDLIGKYGGGKRAKGQKSTGLEIVELDDKGNIMLVRHGEYQNIAEKTKDLKAHLLLNEGIAWNGRKTNNFYNNIMKEINPELKQGATIDLWMNRAGGFVSQELKDGPKYNFLEEVVDEVAKKKNWDIDQAQAAIWVATKGRFDSTKQIFADAALKQGVGTKSGGSVIPIKGKEKEFADLRFNTAMDYKLTSKDTGKAAFDFADALEDNLAFVSWETVPGSYSKHLNQLSKATPNIKSEYQFKVSQMMTDTDGSDIIAKKLKLLSPGHFEAPGYYQGVTNPSGQTKIATTRVKGAGKDVTEMDAPSQELLELYAAIRGVVLNQDAIGYHRFIKAGSQKNANSIAIQTENKFSAEQVKKLGSALDKEFGDGHALIAKEKGVVVLNVGDLNNIEFQKRIKNLAELAVDNDYTLIYYKNGNLITRGNTDYGKTYSGILGQTGRADIRQLLRDLLTKKKQIDKEFAEKYGYDYDERAFSEFEKFIGN